MEFGNTSNKEAPPPNPKKREMLKHAQLRMISMPQGMEEDNSLQQGSITFIAKRFVACSTVYQLWDWAACTHVTGIIISLELSSSGEILGGCVFI